MRQPSSENRLNRCVTDAAAGASQYDQLAAFAHGASLAGGLGSVS